ncbi:protein HAPLESS 2-like isoform X1 [Helianthus annuus]|uniref:protein HAPLESS 2-like isoform X1 n=1 Tax=Helianthus annuus TaxID=4232 RepID=UPI001652D27D|nr:protein HAPLESS 2-like isoform X1 [Helianthus annuus]
MKLVVFISFIIISHHHMVNAGVQILSKSKLEKCERSSDGPLNCTSKIVINMAVPSQASGKEASIVARVDEVEEKSDDTIKTLRDPPVITVYKSAAYALYDLTYIRDVPYKPEEFHVKTRKCESHAGANIVGQCVSLRDDQGRVIEHTQPTCCPCGKWRRVPSSCGNFFNKMRKGKVNTAHCLRFPGDWFHVFGIGQHSVGFNIRINVKTGLKTTQEVVIGPNNRTATSLDNFLRVNLVGDFVGYNSIPSFEDFFLVIPRQGGQGQPRDLGRNFSMWMLLERVRFTLDGLECDKIGVSYEAFNNQPGFCSAPQMSCLHNQLWNFWDADQNRIRRNQPPLYDVLGRFERINEHPNAGSHSFSIGITEVVNSNLLLELKADDIEYVYQRSPGTIVSIAVPTFEALTQYGTATITTNNTGGVEAAYSLTFDCSRGVNPMEEQFFTMKPGHLVSRYYKVQPTSDQAAKYMCTAILKDSDFKETDRAECQFTTTATVLDNGTQLPWEPPKSDGIKGYFESVESFWHALWEGMVDFITGKTCRMKCSSFFDLGCHLRHICMTWLLLFGLFLAIFPTVILLLWLLHETGLFDPIYDWWQDNFWDDEQKMQHIIKQRPDDWNKRHKKKSRHHADGTHKRQRQQKGISQEPRHTHSERHHHVKRDKHKPERIKDGSFTDHPLYVNKGENVTEDKNKYSRHDDRTTKAVNKHGHVKADDTHHKHYRSKRKT